MTKPRYQTHAYAVQIGATILGYTDSQCLAQDIAARVVAYQLKVGDPNAGAHVVGVKDAFSVPPFGLSAILSADRVRAMIGARQVGEPLSPTEAMERLSALPPAGEKVMVAHLCAGDVIALYDEPAQPVTVESVFPAENPNLPGYIVVKVAGRAPELESAFLFSELATALRLIPARMTGRKPPKRVRLPRVSEGEHATILAALRYYQGGLSQNDPDLAKLEEVASNGGEVETLGADAIDDLCERINCA